MNQKQIKTWGRRCLFVFIAALTYDGAATAGPGLNLPDPVGDEDYYDNGRPDPAKVALGAQLFFDKILSGNVNISCATCHHALTDTGDGLALPVGEGGRGLGVTRDTGVGSDAVHERVPRNAPPLFNLGAREFRTLFHDGRVQLDPMQPGGIRSPAGDALPSGLDNVLAVQAMFPVTSGTEMAGQPWRKPDRGRRGQRRCRQCLDADRGASAECRRLRAAVHRCVRRHR